MIDLEKLKQECAMMGIEVTKEQCEKMDLYASLLMEWNTKMNLTAIKKPEEIVTKHFVDSLTLLTVDIPKDSRMIDVGTGAGFPSVPMKIVRPDLGLTLLDGQNKKITFLSALSEALGQKNLCIHARAEEASRKIEHRERYDFATARALAHLRELAEYCLPFVKVGGMFAAMKSGEIDAELAESVHAIKALGGRVEHVRRFVLPDQSSRSIVLIKKTSQVSPKYPRPHAKMAKFPLI